MFIDCNKGDYSMSIYLTGDVHGQIDLAKLTKKNWKEQENLSRNDYLIQLGDLGLLWKRDKTFEYLLDFYSSRKYTLLWIEGNHDNADMLKEYPEEVWNKGKIHRIADNIIHLMRGQVFEINGCRFFTLGGAKSIDKEQRIEGISWWKEEELNYQEQEEALTNLDKYHYHIDYVLTHAAPKSLLQPMFHYNTLLDSTTERFLDEIYFRLDFKHWYFGHYHEDKDYAKFSCLYNRIVKLEES